jgi:PPM family protein phosphatase
MAIALRYAARSDVGLIRSNNQDSAYAGPHLLVVADGMGGHAGGDIASSLAVAELAQLDGESIGPQEAQSRLIQALRGANGRLLDRVVDEPVLAGMGTTVTAMLRAGSRLILAHIGDSRAYRLREGELVQVTSDHTYVQRLVAEGSLTPEEAEHHPQRSVLMRVLTGEHGDEPDLSVSEGRAGDRWLLCSDGLSGVVSADTIHDTLGAGQDPGTTAARLVELDDVGDHAADRGRGRQPGARPGSRRRAARPWHRVRHSRRPGRTADPEHRAGRLLRARLA